jgi:hypothetical protein
MNNNKSKFNKIAKIIAITTTFMDFIKIVTVCYDCFKNTLDCHRPQNSTNILSNSLYMVDFLIKVDSFNK